MRLVIADCSVDYAGRLTAHLPKARRLLMLKGDGSILIHSETGSYKPLNWMNPPCNFSVHEPEPEQAEAGVSAIWRVGQVKTADILWIQIYEIHLDVDHELGKDPGLIKDGVEAHLQELLAAQIETIGPGAQLIRREYMTPIGPVDILAKDANGQTVAIEIKRRGEIDGVEQLTRYLEHLNRDPALAPVRGIFAAQEIKPQAITLATDRGIECLILDYEAMRLDAIDPDSLFG
jgi:RecB family endonuclease NucS